MKHNENSSTLVDRSHYYDNPNDYTSIFHEKIAPYTSVLMNCMYWEPAYPRILTSSQQRAILDSGKNKLIAVGDITCDINGSVEFLSKSSSIEDPFYLADVESNSVHQGLNNHGIMMLGFFYLSSFFYLHLCISSSFLLSKPTLTPSLPPLTPSLPPSLS